MDSLNGHVINLANSIIGVSILAMPYCFQQCGIILSIFLLIFTNILSRLTCHFLLKSALLARRKTFEYLAFYIFGTLGKFFIEVGIIGFLLGTCIAFFVVMGDLGPQIVAEMTGTSTSDTLRTSILMALALFCVLPLGLLRNVDSLSGVSKATIGFYFCLIFKILILALPHLFSGDWIPKVSLWKPEGVLQCLPIFAMALSCQTQLFEIYQVVPNASLEKMNRIVAIAVNICTCVYISVGLLGYIAFSFKPFTGNILLSFEPSLTSSAIKIGFIFSLAFSFPLVIFPCRASLYSLLYKGSYSVHDGVGNYIPEGKFKSLTLIIVFLSLLIGIMIPNIEVVLGLVGSTIGLTICILFPVTSFICISQKNTNERFIAQAILFLGIIIVVLSTYVNVLASERKAALETITENKKVTQLLEKDKIEDLFKPPNIELPENINPAKLPDLGKPKNIEVNKKIKKKMVKNITEPKEIRHEPPQPVEPDVAKPIEPNKPDPVKQKHPSKAELPQPVEKSEPVSVKPNEFIETEKKSDNDKPKAEEVLIEVRHEPPQPVEPEQVQPEQIEPVSVQPIKVADEETNRQELMPNVDSKSNIANEKIISNQNNDDNTKGKLKVKDELPEDVNIIKIAGKNFVEGKGIDKKPNLVDKNNENQDKNNLNVDAKIEKVPEPAEKKSDDVDIEAVKKEETEMKEQAGNEDNAEKVLQAFKEQNEAQKKVVEQLIEVIKNQGNQNDGKLKEEKLRAVKTIENIAKKAIQSIGGNGESNIEQNNVLEADKKAEDIKSVKKNKADNESKAMNENNYNSRPQKEDAGANLKNLVGGNENDLKPIVNSAPLSYQLGLDQQLNDSGQLNLNKKNKVPPPLPLVMSKQASKKDVFAENEIKPEKADDLPLDIEKPAPVQQINDKVEDHVANHNNIAGKAIEHAGQEVAAKDDDVKKVEPPQENVKVLAQEDKKHVENKVEDKKVNKAKENTAEENEINAIRRDILSEKLKRFKREVSSKELTDNSKLVEEPDASNNLNLKSEICMDKNNNPKIAEPKNHVLLTEKQVPNANMKEQKSADSMNDTRSKSDANKKSNDKSINNRVKLNGNDVHISQLLSDPHLVAPDLSLLEIKSLLPLKPQTRDLKKFEETEDQ